MYKHAVLISSTAQNRGDTYGKKIKEFYLKQEQMN